MENLHTPNCIRTYSGIYMNVFEPNEDMINIEDIAHALSNICRFAGHTKKFYSVAQHSIMCANSVPKEFKIAALLHDASEAYLCDIPSPIKKKLNGYKELEDNLMKIIANKFGFIYPLQNEIKIIDTNMLQFEWDNIVINNNLETWTSIECNGLFMSLFHLHNKF